jgi:hypothetical protein
MASVVMSRSVLTTASTPGTAREAAQYWEQRTQQLGLTPAMDHAQALTCIAAGREHALTHPPERPTQAQLHTQRQALTAQAGPFSFRKGVANRA